jgi:hypothetical protein
MVIVGYVSQSGVHVEFSLLGYNAVNPLKVNRHFGGKLRLHHQSRKISQATLLATFFMPISSLAYSSTLKMDAICSSETSIDFQQTTWCYIFEDRTDISEENVASVIRVEK